MRWFFGITLSVLLIGTTVLGGAFYQNTQGKFATEQQRVAALSADLAAMADSLAELQQSLNDLAVGVVGMSDGLIELVDNVSSLANNAALFSESLGSLKDDFSDISESVNALINSGQNSQQGTVANIAAQLGPSVAKIACVGPDYYSYGSGIIVHANGYVLTNYHVVEDSWLITVTLHDNRSFSATVAVVDVPRDLVVLKLNSSRTDFPVATLGSSVTSSAGDQVIALGFPYQTELEMSGPVCVTSGIISAKRTFLGSNWLQTDAAINPGNSGGPLVNMSGEVIGINTIRFFVDDEGIPIANISFAISIDDTKALIAQAVGPQ